MRAVGEDDEVYNTLLKTEISGKDVFATELAPNPQSPHHATQWSSISITANGATCNDDDWGTKAAIPAVGDSDDAGSRCTCADVLEALRNIAASLLVWSAAWAMMKTAKGLAPFNMHPALVLVLLITSLAIYFYELSSRRTFWTVAWPGGGSNTEAFALRVQTLRDAAPVVELLAPDAAPANYRIAEWRDETRPVDPNGFAGAPRGLFFVTFPIEIFPGDPSEASALEFARAQAARAACGLDAALPGKVVDEVGQLCEDAEQVAVRSRLRWADGSEGVATPHVLADGNEADCLRPVLLLCMLCLFGLVADSLLRAMLTPLPWPVRKRIFTMQGNHLGRIRFCISASGEVHVDGDEEDLRNANKFWLKEQDWRALWEGTRRLAPKAARLRRLRVGTCGIAGFAVVVSALAVFLAISNAREDLVGQAIGTGLAVTVVFVAFAGLAGCVAHRTAQNCAEDLAQQLRGSASCSASWSEVGPDMLIVSIEQLATERSAKASQMPIGSHKAAATSSKRELSPQKP